MAQPLSPPFSPPADTLDGYCLAEEVIHALACGALEESERATALAHLDDCELCQALLADEVRGLPRSPSAEDAGLPTLIQLEALVAGRYRIKRFLARGGMGEVYVAWDTMLSERVALKTINPLATSAEQVKASARFRQEVQLSRRVADPHVCRIYEFGQHTVRGFGVLSYLTMEFIEGQTLGARSRQGPRFGMDEVVELSRQMLRGLSAAHAVGVLHRDFKSDNVMLRSTSTGPAALHAVIMDFGLARLLGDQAHRLTERHELVGSAAYMAPEQLEEGAALSEATDVYAFGVVLFEMLTGRLPFEGKSAVAVALRRLTHEAPPPSRYVPELPGAWDELVLRCLERDVSRRFASTEEVIAALDAIAREPEQPAWRSRQQKRITFALAGAVALGAVAAYRWIPRGKAVAPSAAVAARTESLQPQAPAPPPTTVAAPSAAPAVPTPPAAAPFAAAPSPPAAASSAVAPPAAVSSAAIEPPAGAPPAAIPESESARREPGAGVSAPSAIGLPTPTRDAVAARENEPGTPPLNVPASADARGAAAAEARAKGAPAAPSKGPPASAAVPAAPASVPADPARDVSEIFFLEAPSDEPQNSERYAAPAPPSSGSTEMRSNVAASGASSAAGRNHQ